MEANTAVHKATMPEGAKNLLRGMPSTSPPILEEAGKDQLHLIDITG